eukprot:3302851-Ditylum_brightwellii.AAC.1
MGKEVFSIHWLNVERSTLLLRKERHSGQRSTWWQVWSQHTNSIPNRRAQILPNVSSLVARKKGLHKNVMFVRAQTL